MDDSPPLARFLGGISLAELVDADVARELAPTVRALARPASARTLPRPASARTSSPRRPRHFEKVESGGLYQAVPEHGVMGIDTGTAMVSDTFWCSGGA